MNKKIVFANERSGDLRQKQRTNLDQCLPSISWLCELHHDYYDSFHTPSVK